MIHRVGIAGATAAAERVGRYWNRLRQAPANLRAVAGRLATNAPVESARPADVVRVRSPEKRVFGLCILMLLTAAYFAFRASGISMSVQPPFTVQWWEFVPVVMGAEALMFHVERRNQTHSFNLSEIPLVVGFFFAAPWALIVGRLLGGFAYRVIVSRQAALKLFFNMSSFAAESSVAIYVFRTLTNSSSPLSPHSWLVALLAVAVADAMSMIAVTAAIHWTGGEPDIGGVLFTAITTAGVNTSLAILAAIVLWSSPWAMAILALVVVSVSVLYRRHVALSQRYSSLQMLYGFTQMVGASLKAAAVTEEVLTEVRKLLRAGTAEVALLDEKTGKCTYRLSSRDGGGSESHDPEETGLEVEPAWRQVVEDRKPIVIPRGSRDPGQLSYLTRVDAADCMLAPLMAEGRIVGTIMVADRVSNVTTFDQDDLQIFATVANHASVAFENGRLVEQLRTEADERRHEALHDSLTSLPNRTLFIQRVTDAAETGHRHGVMLMDLDRFKEVNDTLGHHNGDMLLQQVATRLITALRRQDTVARLGGDEFAILLPSVESTEEVREAAQRIVKAFEQPFRLEGLAVEVGASIGVAMCPDHGSDASTLLQRADVAMYEAKSTDLDVCLYSPERDHNTPERLTLATELRYALANKEIEVYYQPKARLSDGVVVGTEALARWRHPERGLIGPDQFIPMAEQTGLITPLTMFILQESLDQCRAWGEMGHDLSVSVNLALRSLLDADLPQLVKTLLGSSQVPVDRLTLEITESSVMADPPRTIAVLERLAAIGVKLSVDDFGTGYSSLSYLRRLPVHEVKVDQSFVFRIASDAHDAAIVQSIIELGHNLGLHVVAEGVEDRLSWDTLRRMGCDEVQGYFLTKPIPGSAINRWLESFDAIPRAAEPTATQESTGRARSVLVVDDDRVFRQVVCHMLDGEQNYRVHEAGDGWEAIVLARRHQPDLVLLDLTMPRMSGVDALPSIKAVAPDSRIVVLSSAADKEMVAAAAEVGAVAFIDKAEGLSYLQDHVELVLAS